MTEKLREFFPEQVVYKDLTKNNFFKTMNIPSFMRDWLLYAFENEDGEYDAETIREYVEEHIVNPENWEWIKNRVIEGERVKILAQVRIYTEVGTGEKRFELLNIPLPVKETFIEQSDWTEFRDQVRIGLPEWGILELGYRYPSDKIKGAIKIVGYERFCPYETDPDYYKEARENFTAEEWMDVILGAMDFNADGYRSEDEKLAVLTRLLPFVEKRLNLIELAPKGTAKSYLFGQTSKYGWLTSGGSMTVPKLFYDQSKRMDGLVAHNDYVAFDEVQTIKFADVDQMRSALKGYMENGEYTVGNHKGVGDAGIVLLGNISSANMNADVDMLRELPDEFHESALMDRFHGFLEGWRVPRMKEDLKASGWALNSEYFCTIMHMLRDDPIYRSVVDELIELPPKADTRNTEAVKRIATAWLKLLFPNVKAARDISAEDFERYCLEPAKHMRGIIVKQLAILDPGQFGNMVMPDYRVRSEYAF